MARDLDVDAFLRFIDQIMPDDSLPEWFSIDDAARVLRQVREWFDTNDVDVEQRRIWAERLIAPLLRAQTAEKLDGSTTPITGRERVEMKRKLCDAIGFDISLPN